MFKLDKYGELIIDKIFFDANYPVLFTCVNEEQELFLVVCCQNNAEGKKWLLTKTDESNIIEMLEDKISIREAFLKNSNSQITVSLTNAFEVGEHIEIDWGEDSIYLPKKGEYIDADPEEFDEEIEYYRRRKSRKEVRLSVSYNRFFSTVQTFKDDLLIDEELLSTIPEINSGVITSSIKHRLNISEKMQLESLQNILLQYYIEDRNRDKVTETIKYSSNTLLEKPTRIVDAESEEDYSAAA